MNRASFAILLAAAGTVTAANGQETTATGAAVFQAACAACHANAEMAETPQLEQLREMLPGAVVNTLTNGVMRVQGAALSADEQIAVAEFATGKPHKSKTPPWGRTV
jgi:mono/diheme cytochrome c family protein